MICSKLKSLLMIIMSMIGIITQCEETGRIVAPRLYMLRKLSELEMDIIVLQAQYRGEVH